MARRFSTVWRLLRLLMTALVVLAPAVCVEAPGDRITLVEGGASKPARKAAPIAVGAERVSRAPLPAPLGEVARPEPLPARVAKFILHRALLS